MARARLRKAVISRGQRSKRTLVARRALSFHRGRIANISDVVAVSFGLKETAGELVAGQEPCLKVLVHRKGSPAGQREVAKTVTITDSKGKRIKIPTDVESVWPIELQPGMKVLPSPGLKAGGLTGGISALVASKKRLFVVSAAHVFDGLGTSETRVAWDSPPVPGWGRGALVRNSLLWQRRTDPQTGKYGFVDAGLALIEVSEALGDPALFPWGTGVVEWQGSEQLGPVVICGSSGPVSGYFDAQIQTGQQVVVHGKQFPYWRLLRFRLNSRVTSPGDSGAPILAGNGRLVGMHLGIQRQGDRTYAVALCAGDLRDFVREALADPAANFFKSN